MAEYTLTTPNGFFNSTIAPVFEENIFTEANLSNEIQKPDLTPVTTIRAQVDAASTDKDISTIEFDASANLARQKLISDITSQDSYTRGKRDLEFNINAERDIQFKQGQQLLSDLDTYITSSRATVVQRDYEKQLKKEEEKLKEAQKAELQLMAMKLGVDPGGLNRKTLRTVIAKEAAKQYADALKTSGIKSGGSSADKCPTGFYMDPFDKTCVPNITQAVANDQAMKIKKSIKDANPGVNYSNEQMKQHIETGLNDIGITTGPGSYGGNASSWAADLAAEAIPKAGSGNDFYDKMNALLTEQVRVQNAQPEGQ